MDRAQEVLSNLLVEISGKALIRFDECFKPALIKNHDVDPQIQELLITLVREGFAQGVEIGVLLYLQKTYAKKERS